MVSRPTDHGLPEGVRKEAIRAVSGFAYSAPAPYLHDAPSAKKETAREREEREHAEKMIDKGLAEVRMALANPRLSEAKRSELLAQQGQLEGLKGQLHSGGAGAMSVHQVMTVATQVTTSVSATVSSVGAAGVSSSYMAAQIHSSQQSVELQRRLYEQDPLFREQTNRLLGEAELGRHEIERIGLDSRELAKGLGVDMGEFDKQRADIRKMRQDAKKRGDVLGELRSDVAEADVGVQEAQRVKEEAVKSGNQEKIRKAEENERRAQEEKQKAEERLRQQQQNMEMAVMRNPNLSEKEKAEQLATVRERNTQQLGALDGDAKQMNTAAAVEQSRVAKEGMLQAKVGDKAVGDAETTKALDVRTKVGIKFASTYEVAKVVYAESSGDAISYDSDSAVLAVHQQSKQDVSVIPNEAVRASAKDAAKPAVAAQVSSDGNANHDTKVVATVPNVSTPKDMGAGKQS